MTEDIYTQDGKRVYPCRCGRTHTGGYAREDWNHHNCFHEGEWITIGGPMHPAEGDEIIQCLCMECGLSIIAKVVEAFSAPNRASSPTP